MGEKIEKLGVGGLRAAFLVPIKRSEFEPEQIAMASPCILIVFGEDIELLYTHPLMRDKHIGRGMAQYLVDSSPRGTKLFVRAPACLSGRAEKVWKGVGFTSTSTAVRTRMYTRAEEKAKARPPAGVDTLFLSFVKG